MTVTTPGGGEVAPYDPSLYGDTGLEDVSSSDVVIPRIRIIQDEAVFENNLSKERFDKLYVILLGLIKQRILWHEEVNDGDIPMCKSPDFAHGFPNTSESTPRDKRFPWAKSNFDPEMAHPIELAAGVDPEYPTGYTSNGHAVLPCSSCILKEWDKGDWKTPPCAEQHTYPLLYSADLKAPIEQWFPALLTLQRSGIKPSRTYISSFAQTKTPMFTVFTEIALSGQSRGTVKYAVPIFKRGGSTNREDWREFAERLRTIRSFVRQAPRRLEDEDDVAPESNVNTAPPAATPATTPAATTAKVETASMAESTEDESDLPF